MENGAIFYRLPISAFIQTGFEPSRVPARRLDELQLWNCFSYYPSVHRWDILDGQAGKYIGKRQKMASQVNTYLLLTLHILKVIYLTLIIQRYRHEHKCAHIIALDDGNFAAQPNNRCIWDIPSFTVKDDIPRLESADLRMGMLKIVELGVQKILTSFSMKSRRKKMIKKVKELAAHYWVDHKVEVAIFAILVVSLIIK